MRKSLARSALRAPKSAIETADDGIRTRDLRFTKPLLYQLSYVGARAGKVTFRRPAGKRQALERSPRRAPLQRFDGSTEFESPGRFFTRVRAPHQHEL
jgi:hypothetical protein